MARPAPLRACRTLVRRLRSTQRQAHHSARKGNKERTVSLPNGTVDALNRWITIRGSAPGPLFPHITKGGHITGNYISAQAIEQAIKKRAELAGIPVSEMFKTHDLRRTYISNLLDSSGDLEPPFKHWPATQTSTPPPPTTGVVAPRRLPRPFTSPTNDRQSDRRCAL